MFEAAGAHQFDDLPKPSTSIPSTSRPSPRHSRGSENSNGRTGVNGASHKKQKEEKEDVSQKHLEHAKTVESEWSQNGMEMDAVRTEISHPLKSGLQHLSEEEARAIRHRLRLRLGALTAKKLVSGKSLHDACSSLGLTRYTIEDMNELVNLLADYIGLTFDSVEIPTGRRISESSNMFGFRESAMNSLGKPVWQWPRMGGGRDSLHRSASLTPFADMPARCHLNVVPAQPLMDLFLAQEGDVHRKVLGPRMLKQFQAMKEILLAGDTNRLVAELTFVRINDLAAPPEPMNLLLCLEPLVAIVIIANGVMIGFQTDPQWKDWPHWIAVEAAFACFLILEIVLRMYLQGGRTFFSGNELMWNMFDLFLGLTGVTDVIIQIVSDSNGDVFGTSLLRFCRLIRLVRIVKVFRLKAMKDLRLMVKGLIAGVKTLVMAFTLLFTVLYVISGFATMTLGQSLSDSDDIAVRSLAKFFNTIPSSMFTAFRCATGECTDDEGQPLQSILASEFGVSFIFSYVASYMLVSMGIFNVILAVYVDITMKAAKENDAVTIEQHSKESIRIARITRELLKKFAGAFRMYQDMEDASDKWQDISNRKSDVMFTDGDVHEGIAITKELFLIVIQDRRVQDLMDELDLPPDRANLFEIIDADSSGTLHITELVHGLLKIRGDINKSDVVAGLLATKACYDKVSELKEEHESSLSAVRNELAVLRSELLAARSSCASTCVVTVTPDDGLVQGQCPHPPCCSKPTLLLTEVPLKPQLIHECDDSPGP
ncbi:Catsper1 [Symbiodinium natans]|uniref:Catsper1 protein n=1 Tax=Symbiodinium natans TaxID=878477 RepID=A0A812U1B0_9DINO|nr:Catsper1 [Symbiodinium natans]